MTMDYNAFKQRRMREYQGVNRGPLSSADLGRLEASLQDDWKRYSLNQQDPRNTYTPPAYSQQFEQEQRDRLKNINPAALSRRQQAEQLAFNRKWGMNTEGAALSANDLQRLKEMEPMRRQEFYRDYMRNNGGILSQKDLEALNNVINNRGYQMPTYQDIFNYLTSVVGQ